MQHGNSLKQWRQVLNTHQHCEDILSSQTSISLRLLQNQEADDGAARINRAAAVFYAVFLIGPWLLS